MTHADVAILIPAYKPDARMNAFICELKELGFARLIVVDDGSGEAFAQFFSRAIEDGAQVLTHEVNRGKGAALKTGLNCLLQTGAMMVISADADGQHRPHDVARMADVLLDSPNSLVLGTRDKSLMPLRSRAGNTITCAVLGLLTGLWIDDTQTGLRGLPVDSLEAFARLDGDRYEYEMNMLIKARQMHMPVCQLVIDTVYIDGNKSSHFDTFRDSFRIYTLLFKQIGKYIGSSLMSGVVEYAAFITLLFFYPQTLMLSVVGSRVISASVNYVVNREMVFKSRAGKRSLLYFYLLVAVMLCFNYGLISFFVFLGLPTLLAKMVTDLLLFVVSYNVQQRVIFRDTL